MKHRFFLFLIFCLNFSNVFAIGYLGHDEMVMPLKISKFGFTRIFVPNEKITDIFVYPENIAEIELTKIGHMIIVPKEMTKEALFVSFITDKKTVQDLSLFFIDKKPEAIRILSNHKEVYHEKK